jgi:glycosyltransferase involved in cell wall biosynthesis
MGQIKVVHLITGLNIGGAEMMLYNLLSKTDFSYFPSSVISLTSDDLIGDRIRSLGVPVKSLGISPKNPNPFKIIKLFRWLKELSPDVLQAWMYHANMAGSIAAPLAGNFPVIWSIHHSSFTPQDKSLTLFIVRLLSMLSAFSPRKIISCSEVAKTIHINKGFAPDKFCVIPNGFDVEDFRPDEGARCAIRKELGVGDDTFLIGNASRFHPQKDHRNLIEAAALVIAQRPHVHFVLFGKNITWENKTLSEWIYSTGMKRHFHLLGLRSDVSTITAALDLSVLPSAYGEAFPLAIGEAMATGVPCVATNVGDSAFLIGNTGKIVPPQNPEFFAEAVLEFVQMDSIQRKYIGMAARQRILDNFSLDAVVAQYENLYASLKESE